MLLKTISYMCLWAHGHNLNECYKLKSPHIYGECVPNPKWETVGDSPSGSTELYTHCVFFIIYIAMIKFNL